MLKELDEVRLKTGERGTILENFNDGVYLVEIISKNSEIRIDEVKKEDIRSRIVEVEEAI